MPVIHQHCTALDGQQNTKGRPHERHEPSTNSSVGRVELHHQFVLTKRLCQIDHLAETRARLEAWIKAYYAPSRSSRLVGDPSRRGLPDGRHHGVGGSCMNGDGEQPRWAHGRIQPLLNFA
jgi:hypothetical protein